MRPSASAGPTDHGQVSTGTVKTSRDASGDGKRVAGSPRSSVKKKGKKVHEVTLQSTPRISPYQERKKQMSVEVHAQQQLELEFAHVQKPSPTQIGELSSKLCVPKDFVRQWFSSRRQKHRQLASSETVGTTIPSHTHDITVEIAPTDPPTAEVTQSATVFVSTTRHSQ